MLRQTMVEEKVIRLLWEHNEPVDFDGQFWKMRSAVLALSPYRSGVYPPIWVGGIAPRTLRIIGRLADGWLPYLVPLDDYTRRLKIIKEAAIDAGRDPASITYGAWTYLVIDEDHEQCHSMLDALLVKGLCLAFSSDAFQRYGVEHPIGKQAHGALDYIPSQVSKERALELIGGVPFDLVHDFVTHGTPEEAAAFLRDFVDAGLGHIALQNITFAADERKLGSSFRLMAQLVKLLQGLA